MIKNSYCKINLALSVIARRTDGFNDIESVIYPIRGIFDTLEMVRSSEFSFLNTGITVDCAADKNLCVRAYTLMRDRYHLPPVRLSLHKRIPFGAGLGAGSANAVAVVELCNELFELHLSKSCLKEIAAELGSDTAFFVDFTPSLATGRGEILEPIELDLSGYYIYMVKPDVGVSTREAYSLVAPHAPKVAPRDAVRQPLERWSEVCSNDFETPIFELLPSLCSIKRQMYAEGAIYASMSGSGSTIYGIFRDKPTIKYAHFSHIEMV